MFKFLKKATITALTKQPIDYQSIPLVTSHDGDSGTRNPAIRLKVAKKAETAATILHEATEPRM